MILPVVFTVSRKRIQNFKFMNFTMMLDLKGAHLKGKKKNNNINDSLVKANSEFDVIRILPTKVVTAMIMTEDHRNL